MMRFPFAQTSANFHYVLRKIHETDMSWWIGENREGMSCSRHKFNVETKATTIGLFDLSRMERFIHVSCCTLAGFKNIICEFLCPPE